MRRKIDWPRVAYVAITNMLGLSVVLALWVAFFALLFHPDERGFALWLRGLGL